MHQGSLLVGNHIKSESVHGVEITARELRGGDEGMGPAFGEGLIENDGESDSEVSVLQDVLGMGSRDAGQYRDGFG